MSRYTITVTRTASRHSDPDAIIGYDRPFQTFFLQAFPDADGEDLELWLGTEFREFETLSQRRTAAIARASLERNSPARLPGCFFCLPGKITCSAHP
ncbi:hypothetical protein [Agrobacterium pusense]|uniref:hypothetical protein n=1 Tax=Agrobacterium pusense TaxID=648995 RepID=UPI00289762EA|nr:hypothetical protein [Agrobacterium pusense]